MKRFVALSIVVVLLGWTTAAFANPFVINEVLANPRQDWNDAAGTPFDGTPGAGAATESDEYIELLNVTVTPQSLEDYYLEMLDGTPVYDCFGFSTITPPGPCTTAEVYRVYDSGGTFVGSALANLQAVPAGGYVVIGNPSDDMAVSVTVSLVDSTPTTVDTMDPPYPSTWAGDESTSRFPDGADTDTDDEDVAPRAGTPGSSNGTLCSLAVGDVVVNEIVSDAVQDWDNDLGGTPFDGTAGAGTAGNGDEYIELKNTSGGALDLTNCLIDFADTTRAKLVFSLADAPTAPYVRVFDSAGVQQGTAGAVNAVPDGGYVIVGNPPGSMNLNITLHVTTDAGNIDSVTVNAGSNSIVDESASRFADGADTDVDADDFSPLAATPGSNNGQRCTVAAGAMIVNEVVSDAFQDWNDDTGAGTPFDGTAGPGTASSGDEFVELKNVSATAQDITGCVLHLMDGTDDRFVFQDIDAPADPYVRVFDSTGSFVGNAASLTAIPAGGYVIVGDPPRTMNVDVTVAIETDAGTLDTAFVDANAASAVDEAAARFPDGTDTDVDADDFRNLRATPGTSNGQYCTLGAGDAVINEVVADPQSDWDHDGAGTAFDGTAMSGTINSDDELIELKNTSGAEASFEGCVLEMNDTSSERLILQTLDAAGDPWVRVFDSTGTQVGTATSVNAVPTDGYVLIGNPGGTLNNNVVVQLLSDVVIDDVDFGNDAPDLNASDTDDESLSRLPDGADTGVGANDFGQQRATPGANNEIDECALGVAACHPLATCNDTAAGFDCICPQGYIGTGQDCVDANECAAGSHNCDPNAVCTNTDGSFTCACDNGFTGDGTTCTDVDECTVGTAMCDANAVCQNTPGAFDCVCNTGFEGDGVSCVDNNECVSGAHDCHQNAFCTNTPGSFTCECQPGFDGDGRTCTGGENGDDPESDSGCSCKVGPRGGSHSGLAWLLALGVALVSRRRRESERAP